MCTTYYFPIPTYSGTNNNVIRDSNETKYTN